MMKLLLLLLIFVGVFVSHVQPWITNLKQHEWFFLFFLFFFFVIFFGYNQSLGVFDLYHLTYIVRIPTLQTNLFVAVTKRMWVVTLLGAQVRRGGMTWCTKHHHMSMLLCQVQLISQSLCHVAVFAIHRGNLPLRVETTRRKTSQVLQCLKYIPASDGGIGAMQFSIGLLQQCHSQLLWAVGAVGTQWKLISCRQVIIHNDIAP